MTHYKFPKDSAADSIAASEVASQAASAGLLPFDNGKTPSDVASALLREENARPRSAEDAAIAGSAARIDIGQFAPQVDELVASLAASSAGTITPIPVTTGYEQASQSVLVSQLTAAGYTPGGNIHDFIKPDKSAVASIAASSAASKVAIPSDSASSSVGASEAARARPVVVQPARKPTDFGSSPPLEAAKTPKGPTS